MTQRRVFDEKSCTDVAVEASYCLNGKFRTNNVMKFGYFVKISLENRRTSQFRATAEFTGSANCFIFS